MQRGATIITGCSSGFGLHAAVYLAARGLNVLATMRNLEKRKALDQAAAVAGVTLDVDVMDVTSESSIAACIGRAIEKHGHIDAVVNNAGVGLGGFVYDTSMVEIRTVFETNFFGTVAVIKATLPHFVARKAGRIVNLTSISALVPLPALASYSASKCAVEGFSEALRYEVLPFGIKICLIEPGSYATEIFSTNRRLAERAAADTSPFHEMSTAVQRRINRRAKAFASDVTPVSAAMFRALSEARPPFRQIVGKDAHAMRLGKRMLPSRTFEKLVVQQISSRKER